MSISNHTSHSRSTSRVVFVLAALILAVFAASAQSTRAATANLVVNGSFEKDTNGDGVPNGWIGFFLDPGDKRVCNQSKAGACSFKLVGDGSYKYIKQQIAHNGTSFDDFTLSGWMKGKDIVTGGGLPASWLSSHIRRAAPISTTLRLSQVHRGLFSRKRSCRQRLMMGLWCTSKWISPAARSGTTR